MSKIPYFEVRDEKIVEDFKELMILVDNGEILKKEAYTRLAQKYCLSRSRIKDILREFSQD